MCREESNDEKRGMDTGESNREKDIFLLLFSSSVQSTDRSKMSSVRNSAVSPVTFKTQSGRITRLLMKMLPSWSKERDFRPFYVI